MTSIPRNAADEFTVQFRDTVANALMRPIVKTMPLNHRKATTDLEDSCARLSCPHRRSATHQADDRLIPTTLKHTLRRRLNAVC